MQLSARNILKGTIIEVKKGAATAHVRIELNGGAAAVRRGVQDRLERERAVKSECRN